MSSPLFFSLKKKPNPYLKPDIDFLESKKEYYRIKFIDRGDLSILNCYPSCMNKPKCRQRGNFLHFSIKDINFESKQVLGKPLSL